MLAVIGHIISAVLIIIDIVAIVNIHIDSVQGRPVLQRYIIENIIENKIIVENIILGQDLFQVITQVPSVPQL